MPANLTPDYEKAERAYREATTDEDRLEALRQMLATIPKHKGTEKIQADIKRRLSALRRAQAKRGPSHGPDPFHVPKSGAGQVVLVGPPNVGKSLLVAVTTNAPVKVADYPYTTAIPAPGMWSYEDVQIELVDTPPVTADHVPGGLMGTIQASDIIAIVVDASADVLGQAGAVVGLLEGRGLKLRSTPRSGLDASDFRQHCAVLLANKVDRAAAGDLVALRQRYEGVLEVIPVSAASGEGLESLRRRLWELLCVVRVYTKEPGKPPDRQKPFVLDQGATVEDLAAEIHRDLPGKMRFARVWGDGRYSGQQVQRTEALKDKDIVEIHQ